MQHQIYEVWGFAVLLISEIFSFWLKISEVLGIIKSLLVERGKRDQIYLLLFEPGMADMLYVLLTVKGYSVELKEKIFQVFNNWMFWFIFLSRYLKDIIWNLLLVDFTKQEPFTSKQPIPYCWGIQQLLVIVLFFLSCFPLTSFPSILAIHFHSLYHFSAYCKHSFVLTLAYLWIRDTEAGRKHRRRLLERNRGRCLFVKMRVTRYLFRWSLDYVLILCLWFKILLREVHFIAVF